MNKYIILKQIDLKQSVSTQDAVGSLTSKISECIGKKYLLYSFPRHSDIVSHPQLLPVLENIAIRGIALELLPTGNSVFT